MKRLVSIVLILVCIFSLSGCGKNDTYKISITVPLIENEQTTYYIHKQGYPKVDVVAIPIDLNKPYQMGFREMSGEEKVTSMVLKQKAELNNSLETNIIHTKDCEFKIKEINGEK